MPYSGAGVFSLVAGNPVVTGTTISSTWANNTLSDIATGLSTAVCRDGQSTITANIPMGGFKLTGLGAGSAANDSVRLGQVQAGAMFLLGSVAGTNTITAAASPTMTAYATGQDFILIPANTNTGATTLEIDSLGAKNVFNRGVACTGFELIAGVPVKLVYDGTQFNITPAVMGELQAASLASGSATALVTATPKTIISVSLTAGIWDVSGVVGFIAAATTSITQLVVSISATTNTLGTEGTIANIAQPAEVNGGLTNRMVTPIVNLAPTGTTTYYLVASSAFTVDALTAFGTIRARRIR